MGGVDQGQGPSLGATAAAAAVAKAGPIRAVGRASRERCLGGHLANREAEGRFRVDDRGFAG